MLGTNFDRGTELVVTRSIRSTIAIVNPYTMAAARIASGLTK